MEERDEVRELEEELKNDFKEYKLEENIEYIKIVIEKSKKEFEEEYKKYQNEEFIIVDKDFFERMEMKDKYNPQDKIKLNINEEEIYIELSNNEMIIIIEETEKGNGIYKFVEIKKKEIDYNEDASMEDENNSTKNMSERDVYLLRKFPTKKDKDKEKEEEEKEEEEKEEEEKEEEIDKNKNNENKEKNSKKKIIYNKNLF